MIGRPKQENMKSREMSGFEVVKISSPCFVFLVKRQSFSK